MTLAPDKDNINNQVSAQTGKSIALQLYLLLRKSERKVFQFLDACFMGFWLGVFDREQLYQVDQLYYEGQKNYREENYNLQGFWEWEKQVIDAYFQPCESILLVGAGGGREVFALHQLGYAVDGFECNSQLVEFANTLSQKQGLSLKIQWTPRDQCPEVKKTYSGAIVGWGAYMLIQGRQKRIEFLKQLRAVLKVNTPILLSFFCTSRKGKYFQLVATIGNVLRRVLGREPLDAGDLLSPNFVHYFTKEEVAIELEAAGFRLEFYRAEPYGHAIGISSN